MVSFTKPRVGSFWQRLAMVLTLLSGVTLSTQAWAEVTQIEATIDKNPVIAKESFVLTVTFNDDVSNSVFEPQTLLEDFIVGRTSVSRKTSITNGELSKQTRFSTVLIADQPGQLTIPAIAYQQGQSQPIKLEVLAAGSDAEQRNDRIAYIESTLDTQRVFLQQPLTYIVRLYLAADLNKGNLVPPTIEDADIRQIGTDEESSKMINGRRYKVYQRTFQITPNKSGDFTIKGARFDGEVYAKGQRSIFSSFSNTQPVSAVGDDKTVTVLPVPTHWQGEWLPSELVTISQTLEPNAGSELKVGQPLTLSYQLTAVGVKPEQLPEIDPPFPDSVQVYPDTDESDQFVRNGVPIAQKTVSFALVPNRPGELRLPATEVAWFNTQRKQRQVASTTEVTFPVSGSPQTPVTEGDGAGSPASDNQQPDTQAADPQMSVDESAQPDSSQHSQWWLLWVLVGLLTLSLLGNVAWLWRRKQVVQQASATPARSSTEPLSQNQYWRNLQKACADNNAEHAMVALRGWAGQQFQQPLVSLNQLSRWLQAERGAVDDDLQRQLNRLQQSLYGANKTSWKQGKALYQSLRRTLNNQPQQQSATLPRLYPTD